MADKLVGVTQAQSGIPFTTGKNEFESLVMWNSTMNAPQDIELSPARL